MLTSGPNKKQQNLKSLATFCIGCGFLPFILLSHFPQDPHRFSFCRSRCRRIDIGGLVALCCCFAYLFLVLFIYHVYYVDFRLGSLTVPCVDFDETRSTGGVINEGFGWVLRLGSQWFWSHSLWFAWANQAIGWEDVANRMAAGCKLLGFVLAMRLFWWDGMHSKTRFQASFGNHFFSPLSLQARWCSSQNLKLKMELATQRYHKPAQKPQNEKLEMFVL